MGDQAGDYGEECEYSRKNHHRRNGQAIPRKQRSDGNSSGCEQKYLLASEEGIRP